MLRREFIAGAAAIAALSNSRPVFSQTGSGIKRIAIVHPTEPPETLSINGRRAYKAYFGELNKLGYVEGKNLTIERYSGGGQPSHYRDLAQAIVANRPDLIVSVSGTFTRVLKPLTTTIPIVGASSDPIAGGLVTNLARPEGNITGISVDAGVEVLGKRLQLLREVVGKMTNARVLMPASATPFWERTSATTLEAARQTNIRIAAAVVSGKLDQTAFEQTFEAMERDRVDGLVVGDAGELITNRQLVVDLAAGHRLPAIYPYREFVEVGGLLSYGVDVADVWRRLADVTDQVLKGTKPGDIPYSQQTKFELVLNRTTAKLLEVEFPATLLAVADDVIN